ERRADGQRRSAGAGLDVGETLQGGLEEFLRRDLSGLHVQGQLVDRAAPAVRALRDGCQQDRKTVDQGVVFLGLDLVAAQQLAQLEQGAAGLGRGRALQLQGGGRAV